MPFSIDTIELVGRCLSVKPHYGFGWRLSAGDRHIQAFGVPDAFRVDLAEVLFDSNEARAVVGKIDLKLEGRRFVWGYFAPRTDLTIDLRTRLIACNILLSDTKPYLSQIVKYLDPRQVCVDSEVQLRGSGDVVLLDN